MWNLKALLSILVLTLSLSACEQAIFGAPIVSYELSWQAPVERVDGSALAAEDIAYYVIRWTDSDSKQTGTVEVKGDQLSWVLDLPEANYQFAIATKDSVGRISKFITPAP